MTIRYEWIAHHCAKFLQVQAEQQYGPTRHKSTCSRNNTRNGTGKSWKELKTKNNMYKKKRERERRRETQRETERKFFSAQTRLNGAPRANLLWANQTRKEREREVKKNGRFLENSKRKEGKMGAKTVDWRRAAPKTKINTISSV